MHFIVLVTLHMSLLAELTAHPLFVIFCRLILEMWAFWFRENDLLVEHFSHFRDE